MPYAKSKDGTKLYYKDWGAGPPVVLLHGWPLTGDTFDQAGIKLAEQGFRAIIPDRRGFGRSDKPWNGNDYETYTDDVAAILDQAGISGKIALVGFSMGGGEVARFQTKYPGRTTAAVLISSVVPYMPKTSDNPNGVPKETFDEMSAGMKEDHKSFFTGFFKDFYGVGFMDRPVSQEVLMDSWRQTMMASIHNILKAAEAFGTTDFRPDLANFGDIPTLVIHGDADQTVPIDATGRVVAKALPQAKLIEYPGSAHGLFETDKDRLIDDIVQFLKRVERGQAPQETDREVELTA
ncbi:MAG: alpha/beta hydrolase [Pseudomonadota bacterium]|nr:alpha/beta hydrolase [Pseudomonadota bacterium]